MSAPTNSAQYTHSTYSDATRGPWVARLAVENNAPDYWAVTNGHWGAPTIAKVAHAGDAALVAAAPTLLAEVTALRASLNDAVELCESLRAERDALRAALTSIDNLTRNGPCMSLQAEHEFARSPDALTYKVELCGLVLLIREQARAALGRSAL